jgi:hypothetical protein
VIRGDHVPLQSSRLLLRPVAAADAPALLRLYGGWPPGEPRLLRYCHGGYVRAEAGRVIKRIETRQGPFAADWPAWRPDPRWPRPSLPADWSSLADP